eukprot:TRINITY_DN10380_c0_g1_i2.p1 TRINITY_DN10380_c0_g1~~TRINITY_DN10380_c0_g1_i2.p1  ORF type:complete len:484 (+),score=77.39 TRINITY_DN10380_c0_g1_i2:44-1495(+)
MERRKSGGVTHRSSASNMTAESPTRLSSIFKTELRSSSPSPTTRKISSTIAIGKGFSDILNAAPTDRSAGYLTERGRTVDTSGKQPGPEESESRRASHTDRLLQRIQTSYRNVPVLQSVMEKLKSDHVFEVSKRKAKPMTYIPKMNLMSVNGPTRFKKVLIKEIKPEQIERLYFNFVKAKAHDESSLVKQFGSVDTNEKNFRGQLAKIVRESGLKLSDYLPVKEENVRYGREAARKFMELPSQGSANNQKVRARLYSQCRKQREVEPTISAEEFLRREHGHESRHLNTFQMRYGLSQLTENIRHTVLQKNIAYKIRLTEDFIRRRDGIASMDFNAGIFGRAKKNSEIHAILRRYDYVRTEEENIAKIQEMRRTLRQQQSQLLEGDDPHTQVKSLLEGIDRETRRGSRLNSKILSAEDELREDILRLQRRGDLEGLDDIEFKRFELKRQIRNEIISFFISNVENIQEVLCEYDEFVRKNRQGDS